MRYQSCIAAMMLGAAIAACGPSAAAADRDEVPLTLSGCVVAGEDKDSFLLSNVQIDGTTLAPTRAFYRFDKTEGLKDRVGKRVEVKGKADLGDIDKGKVRVQAEDGNVTTEVSSERRTIKVDGAYFGTLGAMKLEADVPTYGFKVESISPLAGNCSSSAAAH